MEIREAIVRIKDHMRVHKMGRFLPIHIEEALRLAVVALHRWQKQKEALENITDDVARLSECILESGIFCNDCGENTASYCAEAIAKLIVKQSVLRQEPRPLKDWSEDYGDVLWWKFPIEEPPYVGSPLDEKWPSYHTHWTPIPVPELSREEGGRQNDR